MISVIIPVLDEEKALPETLSRVFAQAGDLEVIAVDGGSRDNTRELLAANSNLTWIEAPPGRARQMNAGAAIAGGDWLLFLHADTWLPPDALQTIARLGPEVMAGGFRQQFSRPHWFLAMVSALHNWRCNRSGVIYGDQCLFLRRELFDRIGSFPNEDLLEDVLISERILEHSRPLLLSQAVVTSSRKFEQRGLYRSFFDIVVIMCCYELRLPLLRRGFFAAFR